MTIVTIIRKKIPIIYLCVAYFFISAKILIFFDFVFTKDFVINSNAFFVNKNVYKICDFFILNPK